MTDTDTDTAQTAPGGLPETAPGEVIAHPALRATTMAELGDRLPASGQGYRFHRPNMGAMKRLGQLNQDKKLSRYPGRWLANYLAAALAELGGADMGQVQADAAGAQRVADLPTGDVIALLIAWNMVRHPKGVKLGPGGCGACGADFHEVRVDLAELQVHALPEESWSRGELPVARVGLLEGFAFGGKEIRAVLLGVPSWGSTFGGLAREAWDNPMAIRAATIQAAIRGSDAFPRLGRLNSEALDELMPEDLELLDDALGQIMPAPELAVIVPCPHCGAENTTSLDWRSLGFSGGLARG